MKISCLLFILLLLTGCKQKVFYKTIELGSVDEIATTEFIDEEGIFQFDRKIDQVGSYIGKYKDYQLKLEVVDTLPPLLQLKEKMIIEDINQFDVKDYLEIEEFSKYELIIENIDASLKGKQKLCVKAMDEYQNSANYEFDYYLLDEKIKLDVPYYNQFALNVPLGCEAICLYCALTKDSNNTIDLSAFLNQLPISDDDPNLGFVGDIYGKRIQGKLPAIYPEALEKYGNLYGKCHDISGATLLELKYALSIGHPVLAFVTTNFQTPKIKDYNFGKAFENTHTILLVGYDQDGFIYHDTNTFPYQKVDYATFEKIYSINSLALEVE